MSVSVVNWYGASVPESSAEALTALGVAGVIAAALAERLAGAVRLRNILVHGYLDIDHGRLFDELGWIEGTSEFAVAIERWLATGHQEGPAASD